MLASAAVSTASARPAVEAAARILDGSIRAAAAALRANHCTAHDLAAESIARCERVQQATNAFTFIDHHAAARHSPSSPLTALPISVKANFAVSDNGAGHGWRCSAASRMLAQYTAPIEAECVARLRRAGAAIIAQTNMDEFGMGSHSINSAHFGRVTGACGRSAGGSSGGAALSVSSRAVFAALASDTGGSIRLPAAFNGVVGYKPTYGALSRSGLVAYANSLDTVGIIARDVEDVSAVFESIVGKDAKDATSIDIDALAASDTVADTDAATASQSLHGVTIALPREANLAELDTDARSAWHNAAAALTHLGARCVSASLPSLVHALPAYYIIASAEASSNLARYDGIKFGATALAAKEANNLAHYIVTNRSRSLGPEVQRRLLLGTFALASEAHAQFFDKAQRVRAMIANEYRALFHQGVHLVLSPVHARPAPLVAEIESGNDGRSALVNDALTVSANLAGLPSVTINAGHSQRDSLPLGIGLTAAWKQDRWLLRAARLLERELAL